MASATVKTKPAEIESVTLVLSKEEAEAVRRACAALIGGHTGPTEVRVAASRVDAALSREGVMRAAASDRPSPRPGGSRYAYGIAPF